MVKNGTHNEIMTKLTANDPNGLVLLRRQLEHRLIHFACKMVKEIQEAEDIVDITFNKLWQLRANFKDFIAVRAFLYITVRNSCFSELKYRRHRKEREQLFHNLHDDNEDNLDKELMIQEQTHRLFKEIDKLPTRCREIFILRVLKKYSYRDIAEQFNIDIQTARNQKARAIELLQESLNGRQSKKTGKPSKKKKRKN
jgi:RNA polymerase sigma-19 factor, ECF subfamily